MKTHTKSPVGIFASFFVLVFGLESSVIAVPDEYSWQVPGGLWNSATSWDPEQIPPQGSDLLFSEAGFDSTANLNTNRVRMQSNQSHNQISLTATTPFQILSQDTGTSVTGPLLRTLSASVIESSAGMAHFADFSSSDSLYRNLRLTAGVLNLNSGILALGTSIQGISGGAEFGALNFTGAATATLRGDFRSTNNQNGVLDLGAVSMVLPGVGQQFTIEIIGSAAGANELTIGSLSGGGSGAFIQNNPVSTGAGRIVLTPTGDTSFAGVIRDNHGTHSMAVAVDGSGRQVFTGANTYTGGTVIDSGTLALEGAGSVGTGSVTVAAGALDISGMSASSLTISSGAELGGSGLITVGAGKQLVVEGALAPGNSIGTLTVAGGVLDISSATALTFEIGATADSVLLNGGAELAIGTLEFASFDFIDVAGFGQGSYTLLSGWAGLTGSLINPDGQIGGLDASLSFDSNSLVLTVVPEPAVGALMFGGMAVAVLVFLRRARRRNS